MANLNQCNFIGNLGRDPEMRYMTNGKAVVNFTLAVNESRTKDGQKQERTEWVRVTVYDKLAEVCAKYLSKGKPCFISGKMQTRQWDDKDGNKRSTTEIIAHTIQMLGVKGSDADKANGYDLPDHMNGEEGRKGTPPEFDDVPY